MPTSMRIRPAPSLASKATNALRIYITEQFAEGGKIPGEHELADRLGVNRGTVRQALDALRREGLVTRRQGDGTYANHHVIGIRTRLEDLVEYKELIRSFGFEPRTQQISVDIEEAPEESAQRLNIAPSSLVLVSREVLLADGNPVIYVEDTIPQSLIREEFEEKELAESVFDFLEERCYQPITYSLTEIIPRNCEGPVRKALRLPPNHAILQTKSTIFNLNNEPIMASQTFFREPFIRYHVVKRRKGS